MNNGRRASITVAFENQDALIEALEQLLENARGGMKKWGHASRDGFAFMYRDAPIPDDSVDAVLEEISAGQNFEIASDEIATNAYENKHKKPAFSTLIEEFAELVLSLRGKHDDPPELEITQIGGICINLLAQIYDGQIDHVNNVGSKKR